MAGRPVGVSKGRQGSVTAGSTPSTLMKVCVGSLSPSASMSTTGGTSPLARPVWSPLTPPPRAWEEIRVQEIAVRGASLPRLASSARTGAGAQEGVISPCNSPIASTVVTSRVEASKAARRTSKGQSRISGNPFGIGVTGAPTLAPPT